MNSGRPDDDELVRRALAYPYGPPAGSFVQVGNRTLPVPPEEIDVDGRRGLLAYGSNASPEALTRKLAHLPPEPIAALRVALRGWDVVYSAHVTRYGSVPAAVVPSPGTVASVHLVFPSDAQMEALAATEGGRTTGSSGSPTSAPSTRSGERGRGRSTPSSASTGRSSSTARRSPWPRSPPSTAPSPS